MACFSPIKGYRGPGGKVYFNARDGYYDLKLEVKCGQCIGCRLEKAQEWVIRLKHEMNNHEEGCFLTLTYDEKHLPKDRSLDHTHWQKFAKLLRKHYRPFRFYMVGEYSPKPILRPHYHALVFGINFGPERNKLETPSKHQLWTVPGVELLWKKGMHTIGELNTGSIKYCAAHNITKIGGPLAETEYERVDAETGEVWQVKPQYAAMSLRPGIGKRWLDKYIDDVYTFDNVIIDGKEHRPPAYYDDLLKKADPERYEKIKTARRNRVREQAENMTPERMQVRERIAEQKVNMKRPR